MIIEKITARRARFGSKAAEPLGREKDIVNPNNKLPDVSIAVNAGRLRCFDTF